MRLYLVFLLAFMLFGINDANVNARKLNLREKILNDMLILRNSREEKREKEQDAIKLSSYASSPTPRYKKRKSKDLPRINIQNSNENRNFEREHEYYKSHEKMEYKTSTTTTTTQSPQTTTTYQTNYNDVDDSDDDDDEDDEDDEDIYEEEVYEPKYKMSYPRQQQQYIAPSYQYQQPQNNQYSSPNRKLDSYYKSEDIPLPLPIPNVSASISRYQPVPHRRPIKEPLMYHPPPPPPPPPSPAPMYSPYQQQYYTDENITPTKYIPKSINDVVKLGFKKKNCGEIDDEENSTTNEHLQNEIIISKHDSNN